MTKKASNKADRIIKRQFGEHLKEMRQARDMSLRDLEDQCGLDNSYISKIEQGMVNITLITIKDLAKGLGVHPKELLDYDFE